MVRDLDDLIRQLCALKLSTYEYVGSCPVRVERLSVPLVTHDDQYVVVSVTHDTHRGAIVLAY